MEKYHKYNKKIMSLVQHLLIVIICMFITTCAARISNPMDPSDPDFLLLQVLHCVLNDAQCSSTAAGNSITCPTSYTKVPFNTTVGTTADFCVATYEMKQVGGVATSQSASTPWVLINHSGGVTNAKTKCQDLGTNYHLITNEEWMTVARDIEATAINWSSGTVNSGAINSGHNDNSPTAACDATLENVQGAACTNAGPAGWDAQKRTHTLSNGEEIWDISGNVWEWTDMYLLNGRANSGTVAFIEINTVGVPNATMTTTTFQSSNTSLTAVTNSIGQYFPATDGAGGAFARGNAWDSSSTVGSAGVFSLLLFYDTTTTNAANGFRCAYSE